MNAATHEPEDQGHEDCTICDAARAAQSVALTPEEAQGIREALDAVAQFAVRAPGKDLNPGKVFEVLDPMTERQARAFTTELMAMHMSAAIGFQRAVYSEISNPLDLGAAGLASSCLGEVIAIVAMRRPGIFDSAAAGRRASYAIGEARRALLTQTAGRLILPGED